MGVQKHQIYRASIQVNLCSDPRPVLLLANPITNPASPLVGKVLVAPISSTWDLYDAKNHFSLDDKDPAFQQTGLSRKSYIIANMPTWIAVADLPATPKGILTGDLLIQFLFWTPGKPPEG